MLKIIDAACSGGQVKFAPETRADGISFCSISAFCESGFDPDFAVRLTFMPEKEIVCWMGIELHSAFWSRPRFGKTLAELPAIEIAEGFGGKPAGLQTLLWKTADGKYGFLLPLCKGGYVTSFEGKEGFLSSVTRSGCSGVKECETVAFVAAEGDEPYALAEKCARAAAELVGGGLKVRAERKYPELFDYLGWCSWDSMEIWVNEEEILQKCAEFKEKNIPVRWAILDDMWADIAWTEKLPKFTDHSISFGVMHASAMNDYEADPERFPHGLKGCIDRMKDQFGMKVGIWHPTCGYWQGLEPGGKAAAKLADYTMTVGDGSIMPDLSAPEKAYGYYSTMHAFFKECGADFLKIDNQSFIRRKYRDLFPIGTAAENLYKGIEPSVEKYFGGDLINCMGMAAENMFSRKSSAVSRCSDDFQPENRAWFAKHVLQCAYNGMLQGQFCYNDWDMWWSDDEQAAKNSILRALSGGPIYVSDRLERSRAEIFKPLCFSDGKILRPDGTAVPTADCLLADMTVEARPMKVMNTAGKTGYIAAFNLHTDGTSVEGSVSPSEIPGLSGEKFVLYEHFSGEYKVMGIEDIFTFALNGADDFRLFSFTPVESGVAVIGDTSKFIGAKAITAQASGSVTLYEGGVLKVWSKAPITSAEDESGTLTVEKDGDLYTVRTEKGGVIRYNRKEKHMPEYIDLYDAGRKPLGITVERSTPLEEGQFGLATGVWIFSSDNKIFLTRRSMEKRFMPGKWENTGGGVQAGEDTRTAAVRELFEETGVVCKPEELIFIGTTVHKNHFGDDFALRKDFPLESVKLQPGETCDAGWFTEEEFDKMIVSEELAPSTAANLAPFREKWNEILHSGK